MTVIAYVLTIVLSNICFRVGCVIAGFPVALTLAGTSTSIRTRIAGFVGGAGGIALVVGFGYAVFRLLVGPDSFSLGAFLASTLPLVVAISNDVGDKRKIDDARQELLKTIEETRDEQSVAAIADATASSSYSGSWAGMGVALVVATTWFFCR